MMKEQQSVSKVSAVPRATGRSGLPVKATPRVSRECPRGANSLGGSLHRAAPQANSPVRSAKSRESYHYFASTIFEIGDSEKLEHDFIKAARDGDFATVEQLLQSRKETLFSIDVREEATGNTALIWASKRAHVKIVQLLLRCGADVTLRNYDGQTAVEIASPKIQHLLLEAVDKGGPYRNLMQASWQANSKLVKKILSDNHLDIDCKNADGLTALLLVTRDAGLFEKLGGHVVKHFRPVETARELLQHGADAHASDAEGKTALHYAASSKANIASRLTKVLIDYSAIGVKDRRCFTPIHCASQSGNVDVVLALLEGGAEPNCRGFAGATPLHISALNGHDLVCAALLKRGADVTLVDDSGLSPVDVAKSKRVKATLRQAWVEATEKKKKSESRLNPLRPPSRGDSKLGKGVKGMMKRSQSFNVGSQKRIGEVIFDGLPLQSSGSFDNILSSKTATQSNSSLLSNGDKARIAEETMLQDINDSKANPCAPFSVSVRGNTRTPLVPKYSPRSPPQSPPRSPLANRKLTPLKQVPSPRKKDVKFVAGTKQYDGKVTAKGGQGTANSLPTGKIPALRKCPTDPSRSLAVVGLEMDDFVLRGSNGVGFPMRTGRLRQNSGDSPAPTPTPSELVSNCEDIYQRGRSPSRLSVISLSEDVDPMNGALSSSPPNRLNPLKNPSTPRIYLGDNIGPDDVYRTRDRSHDRSPRKAQVLNLERMQITQRRSPAVDSSLLYTYPNSRKLLPPTPVHDDSRATSRVDSRLDGRDSKDNSPRSDEEGFVAARFTKSASLLRDGDFRIEETQVNSSTDSGIPEDKGSDSKNSSIESSVSNMSSGSNSNLAPAAVPGERQDNSAGKSGGERREKPDTSASKSAGDRKDKFGKGLSLGVRQNTGFARQDTGRLSERGPSRLASKNPTSSSAAGEGVGGGRAGLGRSSSVGRGDQESISAKLRTVARENRRLSSKPGSRAAQNDAADFGDVGKSMDSALMSRSGSSRPGKMTTNENETNFTCKPPSADMKEKNSVQTTANKFAAKGHFSTPNVQSGASISGANGLDSSVSKSQGQTSTLNRSAQFETVTDESETKVNLSTKVQPHILQLKSGLSGDAKKPNAKDAKTGSVKDAKNNSSAESETPKRRNSRNTMVTRVQLNDDAHKAPPLSAVKNSRVARQDSAGAGAAPKMIHVQEAMDNDAKPTEVSSQAAPKAGTAVSRATPKTASGANSQDARGEPKASSHNTGQTPSSTGLRVPTQVKKSLSPRASSNTSQGLSKPMSSQNSTSKGPTAKPPTSGRTPGGGATTSGSVNTKARDNTENRGYTSAMTVKLQASTSSTDASVVSKSTNKTAARQSSVTSNSSTEFQPSSKPQDDLLISQDPSVTIQFNNGEVPIPPPRKKRSPIDRSDSAGSNSSDITCDNPKDATTKIGNSGVVITATKSNADQNQNLNKPAALRPNKSPTKPSSIGQSSVGSVSLKNTSAAPGTADNKTARVVDEEHTGPKIWDPFESLNARRQKEVAEALEKEQRLQQEQRLKSANKNRRNEVKKPERQTSAGKTKRKVKSTSEEAKKRPKSSTKKRRNKSRKKEDKRLTDKAGDNTVALIGGIGWHIEADCNDRTDVKAVRLHSDSSDSEQEINIHVMPDYSTSDGTAGVRRSSNQEVTITLSNCIPGQISDEESSDDDYGESDFEDIPECAEVVHEEVRYIFGKTSPITPRNQCIELEDSDSEADNEPDILPLTDNALRNFENAMTSNELDKLLGPKYAGLHSNPSAKKNVDRLQNKTAKEPGEKSKQNEAHLRRVNSLPNRQKKSGQKPPPASRRPRHASVSEKREEADDKEIDCMIDEILKATPNPSLSLGSVTSSQRRQVVTQRSMTREEFEEAINKDGGVSFREVPAQTSAQPARKRDSTQANAATGKEGAIIPDRSVEDMVKDRTLEEHKELMDWKDKVDNLKEKERQEMEKLMNTVKNMGLKVNLESPRTKSQSAFTRSSEHHGPQSADNPTAAKPPKGPKHVVSPPRPSERLPEKSPRFVRRRDTMKKSASENHEEDLLPADTMSTFGSVDLPPATGGDSFVQGDRAEVVTSRLGRRSGQAGSRAGSVMSNSTDDTGDVIQWKRGNMLGKGAYGVVWCGLTNAGELIAVKQIELNVTDIGRAEAEYEKIQEEVDLLKTLRHENIVGYLGTSLEDTTVSIFMQFVPGGSVASLLARFGALDEEVFCKYTKQILEGVEYLHSNNVIHRDIKGGNIMLMPTGVIKLIDFGCAKRLYLNVGTKVTSESKSRLLKSMRGTPYWMAPEVVKETGHGTKSDIWSIGCTVFEMATRNPPWSEMPPMTAIFAIGSDSKPIPQLPEKLSPEARDFYLQCLTRDANRRPSATALLKHAFIVRRRKSRANSLAQLV